MLQTLECRENMISSLPISLCSIATLEQLDLGSNDLENLPESIEKLIGLHDLLLDGNNLSALPHVSFSMNFILVFVHNVLFVLLCINIPMKLHWLPVRISSS